MSITQKTRHILVELKGHAPFTLLGALMGILFMLLFKSLDSNGSGTLFAVFHPAHVVLSAMVTASMFKLHAERKRLLLVLVVGYFGSIGIATISDVIIPHFAGRVLGLDVPTHGELHQYSQTHEHESHEHQHQCEHVERHKNGIHLGFIEEWYLVNPAALLGIFIAFFIPRTKFPHAAHVLVSTWASSSYMLMNAESQITLTMAVGIFAVLFIAIWIPCCISDIIFPLLFVKSDLELTAPCPVHGLHSHPHIHKETENAGESDNQKQN